MKLPFLLFTFLLMNLASIAHTQINIIDFLRPVENKKFRYSCFFVNNENDTIREITEFTWKTLRMKTIDNTNILRNAEETRPKYLYNDFANNNIYYLEETGDTMSPGPNHFLFSAFACIKNELALAPFYSKRELRNLNPESFSNYIPATVNSSDTLRLKDEERTTLLYGFKMVDLEIAGHPEKISCLKIEQMDLWPKKNYHGEVWISKEYGIVKWIRVTGRTETLIFTRE
jgi:hypothetical protein